MPMIE